MVLSLSIGESYDPEVNYCRVYVVKLNKKMIIFLLKIQETWLGVMSRPRNRTSLSTNRPLQMVVARRRNKDGTRAISERTSLHQTEDGGGWYASPPVYLM